MVRFLWRAILGVAFQAVFLTLLLLFGVAYLVYTFLLKPVVSRAEEVVETADKTYDQRMAEETVSDAERKQAEQELEIDLGNSGDPGQQ